MSLDEWRVVRLRDHVDLLVGPSFSSAKFTTTGVRLVRGANVGQGVLKWGDTRHWPVEDSARYEKYQLAQGDVVLAMDRPWIPAGLKWARVSSRDMPCLLVQRVARMRGGESLRTDYLGYLIGGEPFRDYIRPITTGVNVPHISASQIMGYRFPLPPTQIQRKIAAVLGAYDDLIEVNRRRIRVLEEIAQAIYREWFVNFRYPGHEHDELVKTKVGLIPSAWKPGHLKDVLLLQRGFDLPKKLRQPGNVPIVASTGVVGSHDQAKVNGPGVTTGRSGSLGVAVLVHEDFWPLNTTLWVKDFVNSSPNHALHLLRGLNLENYDGGAAVPTLNRNHIHGIDVAVPPISLIGKFEETVGPFSALVRVLTWTIAALSRSRNILLPRLVSGDLDVSDLDIAEVPE